MYNILVRLFRLLQELNWELNFNADDEVLEAGLELVKYMVVTGFVQQQPMRCKHLWQIAMQLPHLATMWQHNILET